MSSDASECATCGLAVQDPLHHGFHLLKEWNAEAFRVARAKAEKEFEARLVKQEKKPKWSSLSM
jgi:hypothetical protein